MRFLSVALTAAFVMLLAFFNVAGAVDVENNGSDIEALKKRVKDLERRVGETELVDEDGTAYKPLYSLGGIKVSGSMTIIGQALYQYKNLDAGETDWTSGDEAMDGSISADITLETPVGENGTAVVILDFQRGNGVDFAAYDIMQFITSPNGVTTGANGDIESFNNDAINVAHAHYEHEFENVTFTIGHLDIGTYFDTNAYANSEKSQFLAPLFINNPAVEFGGSANFVSPGARLTWYASDNFDVTLGIFEGDGDYNGVFSNPFGMAELHYKADIRNREGNYRLYYWQRHGRPDISNTAQPTFTDMYYDKNSGFGVSFDQAITDRLGAWFRAGVQDDEIAVADRFIGAGLQYAGFASRPNDVFGFGYGASLMGDTYYDLNYTPTAHIDGGLDENAEHYVEIYYNISIAEAESGVGLHITPDFQYVTTAGCDKDSYDFYFYGLRFQAYF